MKIIWIYLIVLIFCIIALKLQIDNKIDRRFVAIQPIEFGDYTDRDGKPAKYNFFIYEEKK